MAGQPGKDPRDDVGLIGRPHLGPRAGRHRTELGDRVRIIVCGGRDYTGAARIAWALGHYVGTGPHTLVHGAYKVFNEDGSPYLLRPGVQPGADRLAHFLALAWGWEVEPHPARWSELGGRAGPERNRYMASLGGDGVIAFPGGSGTASMVACARRADIPVWDLRMAKAPAT